MKNCERQTKISKFEKYLIYIQYATRLVKKAFYAVEQMFTVASLLKKILCCQNSSKATLVLRQCIFQLHLNPYCMVSKKLDLNLWKKCNQRQTWSYGNMLCRAENFIKHFSVKLHTNATEECIF